jgi:hypothetical protein
MAGMADCGTGRVRHGYVHAVHASHQYLTSHGLVMAETKVRLGVIGCGTHQQQLHQTYAGI